MSQEAPADTAGPSSPPPQLPEGWLPQWEGVQRKWYFVQRATGKSQWEIPTEPVVLTPSTTPTSIGTGPTYPPSRPSTDSPRAMEAGTSMAQRIEPVIGSARISSSLDAQLHGQQTHPIYGSPETQMWYLNQTNQQIAHGFGQHFLTHQNQYGSQPYSKYGTGSSPSFQSYGHDNTQSAAGRQSLAGGSETMSWGDTSGASCSNAEGYTHPHSQDSHTGLALASQYSQSPARNIESSSARNHPPNLMDAPPPEPQWHPSQQPLVSNASTDSVSTGLGSSATQQFYRSYSTPQTVAASPREFASRSSQSSNPSHSESDFTFSRENSQSAHGPLSMHLPRGPENLPKGTGHSMSRSHSQHAAIISPQGSQIPGVGTQSSPIYQPHPHPHPQPSHGQYQVSDISQTQSGAAYPSTGYAVPETQGGAPNYQNPPVQSGMPQSLPFSQQNTYKQSSGHLMAAGQSSQAGTLPEYQNPWESSVPVTSRSAASDPQFVSGPWSSTPPTSGPLQHPRHS